MQKKRIVIVVITGLLLIVAAFTWINWNELRENGVVGFFHNLFHPDEVLALEAFVYDSESREITGYGACQDTVLYAGKQGITGMRLNGEWLWDDTTTSFLHPYIKNCGEYTVVAELDGKWAFLFRKNVLVWKTEFQGTIINVDVNAQGYVAVAHELENYSGGITVLSPVAAQDQSGTVLFVNKISSETVISVILSPDSQQMMISGISTEEEQITGSFRFVDLENGETYASLEWEGQVYPLSWYADGETVIAANTGSLRKIVRRKTAGSAQDVNEELWSGPYAEQTLYAVCVVDGTRLVTASGSDSQGVYGRNPETRITVMDLDGKELHAFTVPETVTRLDAGDGMFAVSSAHATAFYDIEGQKLYDYETVSEIQKTVLIDRKHFLVVTGQEAHILTAKPRTQDAE